MLITRPPRQFNHNFSRYALSFCLLIWYNQPIQKAEGQLMYNRNNGREIAARLVVLRDYLFANADKTHAANIKNTV